MGQCHVKMSKTHQTSNDSEVNLWVISGRIDHSVIFVNEDLTVESGMLVRYSNTVHQRAIRASTRRKDCDIRFP